MRGNSIRVIIYLVVYNTTMRWESFLKLPADFQSNHVSDEQTQSISDRESVAKNLMVFLRVAAIVIIRIQQPNFFFSYFEIQ